LLDDKDVLKLANLAKREKKKVLTAAAWRLIRADKLPLPPPVRRAIEEQRTLYVHRPSEDPEWPKPTDPDVAAKYNQLHPDRPFVVTPLSYDGVPVGALAGHAIRSDRRLDQRDISRIETFATLLGLALKNVRFYATLQKQVDARTRELQETQARLVQSEKLSAQAQLVASVAHELNTPVGVVASSRETLERATQRLVALVEQDKDAGTPQLLDRIRRAIEGSLESISDGTTRITEVVERLRGFARLDEAERKRVAVSEVIEDVLAIVDHERPEGVKVQRSFQPVPEIDCYPARLNQLFLNLIMNAFEAMGAEGTLELEVSESTDRRIRIAVRDNGPGIEPEALSRLFEPGFSTKGGRIGAGLGLTTCQHIVEDHGGELRVDSALGHGTTFTVFLPIDLPRDG